jgi:hypothetical protein
MKNQAELANQNEMDQEILFYVREMQPLAQIVADSVLAFLRTQRRRQVALKEVQDRLDYLADAGYLKAEKEWQAGEIVHYKITALGRDLLDGAVPPRGWNSKQ